ncbi:DNA polymerase III subunit delta' [Trichocoleus sp. FACHB-262]|uniref:DNA polymerase III subunit delta' n=1 Tax=Trichocoleus sp. FACHB-262 TaxID=2692869 RepID=UPI0016868BFE|nr:DNA polymerase III subunit delta' [Trichocoleus sp. FACHB-262]MBD2123682.1 DNA polymerase III subunit delta' [Trichocoleus sp. FACHB-262]
MVSTAFAPLIGQSQAIELLYQAVLQQRVAPAYLFAGPSGVGRSLAARCFLESLLALDVLPAKKQGLQNRLEQGNHPDLLWVQPTYLHQGKLLSAAEAAAAGLKRKAPPQIRLDQVRQLAQFLGRPPMESARSVVVIEQAETMAEAAANGLLKTLEEPGPATLILIAPGAEVLLPTLVSRCQRIPFYRLSPEALGQVLEQAGYAEILQHPELLEIAQGSPGEAIASWQQLQAIPPDLLATLTQPLRAAREALELARRLDKALDTEAQLWLIDYLQHALWRSRRQPQLLQHLEKARQSLLSYAQPRLVWEVTLMAIAQA